jgi:hypothetical protein
MPPIDSRKSTSFGAKSPGSLYLAMPYSFRPPAFSRASKTTTSWPSMARRCAQDRPAGPAPTTAMVLPVAGRALERVAVEVRVVDRVALQQADLHGLAFGVVIAHAGVLAQDLGRADARAAAAEDVLLEDADGGAVDVLVVDVADEAGDVDAGRAGARAGGVVAVQAARASMAAWRLVSGGARSVNCAASGRRASAAGGRCWRDSIMASLFVGVLVFDC